MCQMQKAAKTRCSNTLTESQYWSMIRSHLRQLSLRWIPRSEHLIDVRKTNTGQYDKRIKFIYQCEQCTLWFPRKMVEADHRVECGSLRSAADVPGFIERLLVEKDGWRCLCKACHQSRTRASRRKK